MKRKNNLRAVSPYVIGLAAFIVVAFVSSTARADGFFLSTNGFAIGISSGPTYVPAPVYVRPLPPPPGPRYGYPPPPPYRYGRPLPPPPGPRHGYPPPRF